MSDPGDLTYRFMALFGYRGSDPSIVPAYGTGKGQWIKRLPQFSDFHAHLRGDGPGLGLPPLRLDGRVTFAAIDLDEPDFAAALKMQEYLPGPSFIERSRSGNAHVWVFFDRPVEAYVVRGILKEAYLAADKKVVEVFPKQDRLLEGMVGNYINLPFYGDSRPILMTGQVDDHADEFGLSEYSLQGFVNAAELDRNDSDKWQARADWLLIVPPELRESSQFEFGEQPYLHMCAEYILQHCEDNPLVEGHRNAVFFALAKQFSNCSLYTHDETWALLRDVNNNSPDPAPEAEIARILRNAERGQYTSTDCDNVLVQPYCHPSCPIAFPNNQ